jgi:hypothetical protein
VGNYGRFNSLLTFLDCIVGKTNNKKPDPEGDIHGSHHISEEYQKVINHKTGL